MNLQISKILKFLNGGEGKNVSYFDAFLSIFKWKSKPRVFLITEERNVTV